MRISDWSSDVCSSDLRGAEVANILRFEKDFPGATVIRLEQNYRSTPHILGAASGMIANNGGRLGKTLWTEREAGEKVRVMGVWDGPEEASFVGERIETHIAGGGRAEDCEILVSAQLPTRDVEARLISIGLAYRTQGGIPLF